MADWSAVYLRDTLRTGAAYAAAGYAAFSLTMTLTRFRGDALVARLGAARVVRMGGMLAALGTGGAILLGQPGAALLGFACVGVGMATIVPLVFSAAGQTQGMPSGTAIAAAATMGYSGFLAGPPLIGFLAEGVTLRGALGVVALLGLVIAVLSGQMRRTTGREAKEKEDGGEDRVGHEAVKTVAEEPSSELSGFRGERTRGEPPNKNNTSELRCARDPA